MTPLSSYFLPCHSPFQVTGLPSFQSDFISVPNMYCLMADGVTSACHTCDGDALTTIEQRAMRLAVLVGMEAPEDSGGQSPEGRGAAAFTKVPISPSATVSASQRRSRAA